MKFSGMIQLIQERFMDGGFTLSVFLLFVGLCVIIYVSKRWGAGVLLVFPFVFIGFTRVSGPIAGIGLLGQYILVVVLTGHALFSGRYQFRFSPVTVCLLVFLVWILMNSLRSRNLLDSFGHGLVYLLFFPAFIIGGQKSLSDLRGRQIFTLGLIAWSIAMTFVQLPFYYLSAGRFEGVFENVVGFMVVGQSAVIILFLGGTKEMEALTSILNIHADWLYCFTLSHPYSWPDCRWFNCSWGDYSTRPPDRTKHAGFASGRSYSLADLD